MVNDHLVIDQLLKVNLLGQQTVHYKLLLFGCRERVELS